jgi:hypothetical protein
MIATLVLYSIMLGIAVAAARKPKKLLDRKSVV